MERYELAVEGMACTGCEERVTRAAAGVEGVRRAAADHEAATVEVTADRGTEEAVRRAIGDAGYDVSA